MSPSRRPPRIPHEPGHASALARLPLAPEVAAALGAYLDLLAAWSGRVNLTGARTPQQRVETLVADILPAAPLLEPGELLDVGSGNGSPGLVLALLRPDLGTTLLEPRLRRWAFLREAVRAVGRPDVRVRRVRHDGYAGPPARNLTLRGLDLSLTALAPLVAAGGQVLALGGSPTPDVGFQEERAFILGRLTARVYRKREGA